MKNKQKAWHPATKPSIETSLNLKIIPKAFSLALLLFLTLFLRRPFRLSLLNFISSPLLFSSS
jgi:hypothetical protein